jgi:hypothetical protein
LRFSDKQNRFASDSVKKTRGDIELGNRGCEEALASITAREKAGGFVLYQERWCAGLQMSIERGCQVRRSTKTNGAWHPRRSALRVSFALPVSEHESNPSEEIAAFSEDHHSIPRLGWAFDGRAR